LWWRRNFRYWIFLVGYSLLDVERCLTRIFVPLGLCG